MTARALRCVGYLRVSTERQAGEQYTSLADQERAIAALAARLEHPVERWFSDAGASGATSAGRPALLKDRLLARTRDFAAVAQQLQGVALRELLAPWLERCTYDKRNRTLVVRIRRLPAVRTLHPDGAPARDLRKEVASAVTRQVRIARGPASRGDAS